MRLAAGLLALCLGPAFAAENLPASLTGKKGDPSRGRQIVANRQVGLCLLCHSGPFPEERFQGDLAPDLKGVGMRLSEAEIRARIVDPSKANPKTIMPAYYRAEGLSRVASSFRGKTILSAEQIEDVVAYLYSKMTTRREFLIVATASLAAPAAAKAQVDPNLAANRKAAFQAALSKVVGDAKVRSGRVKLLLPPLIDNGNSVPLSVTVESPMTETDHVKAIYVLTEKNPLPDVASVHLGPRAGRAFISTRVRLADTQTVTAIAQMSDGSFWSDSAEVVVTLSACLEEGLI